MQHINKNSIDTAQLFSLSNANTVNSLYPYGQETLQIIFFVMFLLSSYLVSQIARIINI